MKWIRICLMPAINLPALAVLCFLWVMPGIAAGQNIMEESFNDTSWQLSWKTSDKIEQALWLGVSGSRYLRFHPNYPGQFIQSPVRYQPAGTFRLTFAWNQAGVFDADSVQVQVFDAGAWKTIQAINTGNGRTWQTDSVSFSTAQDSFSIRWLYFSTGQFPAQYFNLDNIRVEPVLSTSVPVNERDVTMMVMPNPGPGYFQVVIDNPRLRSGVLEVFSASGSRVFEQVLPEQQRMLIPVDLSGLSKGVYVLTIKTPSEIISQKLLIQ